MDRGANTSSDWPLCHQGSGDDLTFQFFSTGVNSNEGLQKIREVGDQPCGRSPRPPQLCAGRRTGHKTRSVFERYNIVSECDLVEAAKKLNTLQPIRPSVVRLKPDTTSEDRDGHNPGTVEPDRGSRQGVSL